MISGIVLSCLLLSPIADSDETTRPEPDRLLTYKTVGDVTLQLHLFEPEGHQASDRRAALVLFFGGGWKGGSPTQFYRQCRHLADRGLVAFCAEYRTSSQHGTTPRACVRDGKSAVRWIRQHAEELGIDPQRIAAGGGSAGGHVAAATGTVEEFNEFTDDLSVSCRPDALVLFNPVFDNGPDGYGHDRVKDYWEDFSPLHNISADTPPSIVFLGTQDKLIPVSTAETWKQKLQEAGVRCDLHLYEDQPHGFFNRGQPFADTLQKADAFLVSLGFLQPKPDAARP